MSLQQGECAGGFVSDGQLNRVVGWTMLVIGLALVALLDPWFFGARSAIEFAESTRPAVRHALGVVLGMALLQLAMAHLLATSSFSREVRQIAALLTTLGALVYAAGYVVGVTWPVCRWMVLVGSLVNFTGFAYLLCIQPKGDHAPQIRMILAVVCFGMLLDFVAGLFQFLPEEFVLDYFGATDGFRLRMMRLARVAVIALSVLTLLYYGVARRAGTDRGIAHWGGLVLACGAIGMPAILAAACFTSLYLKYLLVVPATAVLVGVFLGLLFGVRHARPLEQWGWALIAISTSVGMLMGLYAFDGPLGTPEFLGEYNEMSRRLSRIAHSYSIVLGMLTIFLARELDAQCVRRWPARLSIPVYVTGSATTVGVLVARIAGTFSTYVLCVGPAVAVIGTVACLASCGQWPRSRLTGPRREATE